MHPFGGTPICPRCNKAVYAAEQIMGPGRKLYHKPCLVCTTCRKRLDSYSLVEHNQDPYCKQCHIKNFGTRDLRHANLPDRDDMLLSPPTSPTRNGTFMSPRNGPSPLPATNAIGSPTSPVFKPNRALSPTRRFSAERTAPPFMDGANGVTNGNKYDDDWEPPVIQKMPSHLGRAAGGLPRTLPLDSTMTGSNRSESPQSQTNEPPSPVRIIPTSTGEGATAQGHTILSGHMTMSMNLPLTPKGTGTRYGAAFSGRTASPMSPAATGRSWGGGGNPSCGKCGKTVYFAEQVKALGKTYHKNCLRCTECNTLLDSSRLTENEGSPYCTHCYSKLYGPSGSGYALLGKAGG